LQTRKWTDDSGVEKYSTEIVLKDYNSTLQILNSIEKEVDKHSIEKSNGYAPQDDYFSQENIPF
jgi:single-stranded DNA-binding protein